MRKSRFVLLVIVSLAILTTPLTMYAQATTPAANPATAATPSAATPAPLAIFTNYPSQVVGLGETATLPLAQSVLLIWPQLTCLIAATILLFALACLLFQRQEIRA